MGPFSLKYIVFMASIAVYFYRQNVANFIISNGFFREIINHHPGKCRVLNGIKGSEDMHQLSNGKVIITSDIGNIADPTNQLPNHKGRLFTIDLESVAKKLIELELPKELEASNFFPHGISVLERPGKFPLVYVINHPRLSSDRVEKLEWDINTNKLKYLKSFTDPKFTFINDLVVYEEDVFYVTVFLRSTSRFMREIEGTFKLPLGYVLLYNHGETSIQADGLSMPNGINLSNDKKLLYLAEGGSYNIQIFKRHGIEKLELIQNVPLHTMPDNISVDKNGDLLIGCHPKLIDVYFHLHDNSLISPSQILRVKIQNDRAQSVTEIFADNGNLVKASTVAVVNKNALLIGTIGNELLLCDIHQDYLP
ncbi:unnamed protein product [Dimorphilus gyrociliatus]|uniref:Paraoxonase n=1 Tax=Dimorphilus gyrociliatus TaxID=2664684 RepID=A0A7I8WFS2_9ANNE|nr:unnamed protein product [Dimorphilus gyrociliatus]